MSTYDITERGKIDTADSFSEFFQAVKWEKSIANQKSWRQKSQWENVSIVVQGSPQKKLAPLHSVKNGILQSACSTRPIKDANSGASAFVHTTKVDEQHGKRSKNNCDKSAVSLLKITRQLGCVLQDMEPKSSFTEELRHTETNPMCSIHQCGRYVMLTFETKIHRLEWFAKEIHHPRDANAPKFEDRSQEETEWQKRCAR